MVGFTSMGVHGGGGAAALAKELAEVAATATRAADRVGASYVEPPTLHQLKAAFNEAGRAATQLEDLKPRIAVLDGGEDGLLLAQSALEQLGSGQRMLQTGVAFEDDLLRGGGIVAEATTTEAIGRSFKQAAAGVRGIADIAQLEATGVDELFAAIMRRAD